MLGKVKSFTTEDTQDTEFCQLKSKSPTLSLQRTQRQGWGIPFWWELLRYDFPRMRNYAGRLL